MALISLMVLLNNLTYLLAKPNNLAIFEADQVRWFLSRLKYMLAFLVNSQNIVFHMDDERLKLFDKIDDLAHEADKPPAPCIDHLRFRVEELIDRIRTCERDDCASFYEPIQAPSLTTEEDEDVKPIGLERDSGRLVHRLTHWDLMSGQDWRKLNFIVISGKGGIGKTTLANIVYNDVSVTHHFARRAWITVSREYRLRNLLLDILNHVTVITEEIYDMEERELKQKILDQLQDRRYLIVMDDVWTTEVWDELKDVFPDNKLGNRVVLTTRCPNVLQYALPGVFHQQEQLCLLDLLPRKRGLVRKVIFGDQECPYYIADVLKRIENGCREWPIASVVAGSILKTSKDAKHIWPRLAERLALFHEYPHVPRLQYEDEVLGILSLCYEEMPQHLKTCFLYMSIFPAGFEISAKQLIQLWIAEGLIPWEEDARPAGTIEGLAEGYLKELVSLKLVQVIKRRSNGTDPKSIRIHDFIRELCISLSWDEIFVEVYGHSRIRKLWKLPICGTLATDSGVQILWPRHEAGVGSFKCLCKHRSHILYYMTDPAVLYPGLLLDPIPSAFQIRRPRSLPPTWPEGCKKLWIPKNRSTQSRPWVLSIIRSCATYIKGKKKETSNKSSNVRSFSCFSYEDAGSVSREDWTLLLQKFPSLRVLNLGLEEVGILPNEAIQHLAHLRYIKVRPGVTKSVFKLSNLQTIDLRTSRFGELPKDIWKLQHLRHLRIDGPTRLPEADDESNDDQDGCCLPNLLTLSYISVDHHDEISKKTPNLKKLGLYGYECFSLDEQESTFNLPQLQSLKFAHKCTFEVPIKFPTTITKISVKKTRLEPTAVEMFGELPNLQILKLVQTIFGDDELVFGKYSFPQLQVLKIEDSNLVSWKLEKGAIQKLRRLVFIKCRLLRKPQPGLLQRLTSLEELEFIWTNRTFVEKLNDEARELKKEGLKIKIHPQLRHDAKA